MNMIRKNFVKEDITGRFNMVVKDWVGIIIKPDHNPNFVGKLQLHRNQAEPAPVTSNPNLITRYVQPKHQNQIQ